MRPKLVIFDCDGVLADTEETYFNMNRSFIRSRGGDFDLAYYEHFIGLASDLIWAEMKERFALAEPVAQLIEMEKENKAKALRAHALRPVAGVSDFIRDLTAADIPLAVASSGRRDNVQLILEKTGLIEHFKAIVTGEDIVHGKPAPDIFLKAASLAGRPATESIVIEDSRNGVLGAKAARMRCVGYLNPQSGNQDLSQADIRITSFNDTAIRKFCAV